MEARLHPDAEEDLLARARGGDRDALERVIRGIRDDVYNLAVRMLWVPEDAEDATQEILIRVITHLGSFRGQSSFRTWVYRIAANHLLNVRKSISERREMTFATFSTGLHDQVEEWFGRTASEQAAAADRPDRALLLRELRIGCTHAMLLCLPREQRIALILADIFQLASAEGAAALEISPAAFRKRASRAREAMRGFLAAHCGLVNPAAFCRCEYRLEGVIERGMMSPDHLRFADRGEPLDPTLPDVGSAEWDELDRVAAVYRSAPRYSAPEGVIHSLRELLDSGRYRLLN